MDKTLDRLLGDSRIARTLESQHELTRKLMAMLNMVVDMCNRKGCALEAVRFSTPTIETNSDGATIGAAIFFDGAGGRGVDRVTMANDIHKFLVQRNMRCAAAMERNPRILEFWQGVLTCAENYATYKRGRFVPVKVPKAYITPNEVVKFQVEL